MSKTDVKNYQEVMEGRSFSPDNAEPAWLLDYRRSAFDRFRALGLPTRKLEDWKYMSLEPVYKMPVALAGTRPVFDWAGQHFLNGQEIRFSFLNGAYAPEKSLVKNLPQGVSWTSLKSEKDVPAWLEKNFETQANAFTAINGFSFEEAFVLRVSRETAVTRPLHFLFAAEGGAHAPVFYPKIFVVVETGSRADIVLDSVDPGAGKYFMDASLEFHIAANATLNVSQAQRHSPEAVHFVNTRARIAEGGSLNWVSFTSGGLQTRNETEVLFDGPGASCDLEGLALMDGNSQIFQHLFVRHQVPSCTSRQVFRNILAGSSVAEFDSLVHVARGADKSDSGQLDRNLLLSDKARAYSRPQLKIDADDVKASHGAATGKIEKDEFFYLLSRGLSKQTARFLLTYGFAEEVLERMSNTELRVRLEALLEARIQGMTQQSLKEGKV